MSMNLLTGRSFVGVANVFVLELGAGAVSSTVIGGTAWWLLIVHGNVIRKFDQTNHSRMNSSIPSKSNGV
jgi:hypothetical protein